MTEASNVIDLDSNRPADQVRGTIAPADAAETLHVTPRMFGVLVVDDEASVRGVLSVWMRQEGFLVWVAADGLKALDLYRRHHQAIDVVLMDVRMPGLDGPQTLLALRELNPQVRCCFMSGDLGDYTTEGLQGLDAIAVLWKPLQLGEIAGVLVNGAARKVR